MNRAVILALLAHRALASTVFGTISGYDAGGSDPMCWASNLANSTSTDDILGLNEALFDADDTTLLSSCFPGTDLDVEPLDLPSDRTLFTGQNYTFRLQLQVDLSNVSDEISIESLGGASAYHCRLVLCDAIRDGFCNPLEDSREIDNDSSSETDLDGEAPDNFRYNQGNALLGLDNDLQVISRWVRWTLREQEVGGSLYQATVDITLQLPRGTRPGAYFFVGHAVVVFDLGGRLERVDVADALPDNIVSVEDPPVISYVSNTMVVCLSVAAGVFGFMGLAMLIFVMYHREHPVIKLGQSHFLAAIAGSATILIISSFTLLPLFDIFCIIQGPITFSFVNIIGSILVARVWRVYSTLSSVLALGRKGHSQKRRFRPGDSIIAVLDFLASLPFMCLRDKLSERKSLRRSVTVKETCSLIFFLSAPQLGLQIFSLVHGDYGLEIELDETGKIGREVCDTRDGWVRQAALGVNIGVYLLGVFVAWIARDLPSAFNEKTQIFNTAAVAGVAILLSFILSEIMDIPATSPDALVFMWELASYGVALSVLIFFIWPKIQRVMSGEKVVVTNILSARFDSMARQSTEHSESGDRQSTGTYTIGETIKVGKDDPIPRSVETRVLVLQDVLREITEECGEGRPLNADVWGRLRIDVARLKNELDRVELSSETVSETDSHRDI